MKAGVGKKRMAGTRLRPAAQGPGQRRVAGGGAGARKSRAAAGTDDAAAPFWRLDAEGFFLTRPVELRPWVNYMGNGRYGLRLSHLGDGYAATLEEPRKAITNYDFFSPLKGRFLYVKEREIVWNPSYYPTKTPLARYECSHGTGWTRFRSSRGELEVASTHFVPRDGCFEIWTVETVNHGRKRRTAALYPLVEFLLYESFAIDPVYYSWFTNTEISEDGRTIMAVKSADGKALGFFRTVEPADSFEAGLSAFRGNGDVQHPESLSAPGLSNQPGAGDPSIGCFQFSLDLAAGEAWRNALFIGEGAENLDEAVRRFPDVESAFYELEGVKRHWKRALYRPEVDRVGEGTLRDYLKTFFPYQIFQQSGGLVRSTCRGYRDVAQDAMGLGYFDPAAARTLILDLLDKQDSSGRCLRQWNTAGSFHDTRDFRDLPFWLPIAAAKYVEITGDAGILQEKRPFLDDGGEATLLEHIQRGVAYSLQFGPHGLLVMGAGDWNDALSGLGPGGESVWLSQCAYLALGKIAELCAKAGLESDLDTENLRRRLSDGVLSAWTGKWFLRAYHENGKPIGGEERIFLLPQAWFTVSGMSALDPAKAKTALDSMIERLDSEWGLLKCRPAFERFDPGIGNLSALAPGMAENFAVYNHASAFAVYALFQAGRDGEAVRYLRRLLPIFKDPMTTRAEPYVLVNFYNGGYYPSMAGRGGIPWLTSTVSWLAMCLFDHVFPRGVDLSGKEAG